MKKAYIIGLMACSLAACKPEIDQEPPSPGDLDVSRYLAIGNSATAGFRDGSLYMSGQLNSYPAILAKQFEQVGGGPFRQPLLPNGDKGYPMPKLLLRNVYGACDTATTTVPEERGKDSAQSATNISSDVPFNNFGIPYARVIDYIRRGYGKFSSNVWANRMFRNPETATPLEEALRVQPSFYTLSLGNNDVMLYAMNGGDESPVYISDGNEFRTSYDSILTALARRNAKGVALNIPDIRTMPFFTTIPAKGLKLNASEATSLNNYYRDRNIPLRFDEGDNYFIVQESNGTLRKLRDGELVLLSTPRDSIKCAKWGSLKPIPMKYILNTNEVDFILNHTANFNRIITELATAKRTPVVDIDAFLKSVQTGVRYNGVGFTATFISGGVYSLDGIHLTPRGNALMANEIIKVLNTSYSAKIPMIDVNNYPGLTLP
ncbi:MAG: hypothetical protein EOP56_01240 [Sphingobacteriales bacterium]|nr:MAG: hypothetical protein EOP56_01240 [Sphingobacteriales bacterium]